MKLFFCTGAYGGEFCRNYYDTLTYCTYGCCGYLNRDCCSPRCVSLAVLCLYKPFIVLKLYLIYLIHLHFFYISWKYNKLQYWSCFCARLSVLNDDQKVRKEWVCLIVIQARLSWKWYKPPHPNVWKTTCRRAALE